MKLGNQNNQGILRDLVDAKELVNRSDNQAFANVWWCNHCNTGTQAYAYRGMERLHHIQQRFVYFLEAPAEN